MNQSRGPSEGQGSCPSELLFVPVRRIANNPAAYLLDLLSQDSLRSCPAKAVHPMDGMGCKPPWIISTSKLIKRKGWKGLKGPSQHFHAVLETHWFNWSIRFIATGASLLCQPANLSAPLSAVLERFFLKCLA